MKTRKVIYSPKSRSPTLKSSQFG